MNKRNKNRRKGSRSTPSRRKRQSYCLRPKKDHPWVVLASLVKELSGYLIDADQALITKIIRSRSWEAYDALSDRWSLQSMDGESSLSTIRAKRQIATLLSKIEPEKPDSALPETAYKAVRDCEEHIKLFHIHGRRILEGSRLVNIAKRWVSLVLGDFSSFDKTNEKCRHGPGTATGISFRERSTYFKYSRLPYPVTTRSLPHAKQLIMADQRWWHGLVDYLLRDIGFADLLALRYESFLSHIISDPPDWIWEEVFILSDSNRISSVPKDRRKNRPIAIEHPLNVMLQLGVDGHIRSRLKRFGINLDNQTKNIVLAREGSRGPHLYRGATVDLASASDTVSLGIVKMFVDPDWYEYLCDLRSPYGTFPDGETIRYRKLSSMGNGYTFAVESLVFGGVVYATLKEYFGHAPKDAFAVFGDDLIVPEGCVKELIRNLKACGFLVNTEKSFLQGPVKESCGADWWNGCNVRPIYMKKRLNTLSDLFSIRNRLTRWLNLNFPELIDADGGNPTLDATFLKWMSSIPNWEAFVGPCSDTEFDSYWHCSRSADSYRNQRYEWTSLSTAYKLRSQAGAEFNFLKLQHTLRPLKQCQWTETPQSAGGSRFDLIDFARPVTRVVRRRAPYWQADYNAVDYCPPKWGASFMLEDPSAHTTSPDTPELDESEEGTLALT